MQAAIKKVRSLVSPSANKKHSYSCCRCNGVEMSEGKNLNIVMIADVDTFLLCTILFPIDTTTLFIESLVIQISF